MDIEQLRTFLEVSRTRHFRIAGEELFVTQSAVSARIKKLEEELGVKLLERQSRAIKVTPEGYRMLRYAEAILAIWRRARQDVALTEDTGIQLAVGGLFSLWDILLQAWIQDLQQRVSHLALLAEAHDHDYLLRRLLDGALDLIFVYEPPQLEEVRLREVSAVPLIMVSSKSGQRAARALERGYVMIDWGYSFALQHAREFPDARVPSVRMNQARMALTFILNCGGAAYLAEQTVLEELEQGLLHRVVDAPPIMRYAYAVYSRRSARAELIEQVLSYF